jgi:hypothetical protein
MCPVTRLLLAALLPFCCCVLQTLLLAVSRSAFESLFGPHTMLAADYVPHDLTAACCCSALFIALLCRRCCWRFRAAPLNLCSARIQHWQPTTQPCVETSTKFTFACCYCSFFQTLLLAVSRSAFESLFGPHTALAADHTAWQSWLSKQRELLSRSVVLGQKHEQLLAVSSAVCTKWL